MLNAIFTYTVICKGCCFKWWGNHISLCCGAKALNECSLESTTSFPSETMTSFLLNLIKFNQILFYSISILLIYFHIHFQDYDLLKVIYSASHGLMCHANVIIRVQNTAHQFFWQRRAPIIRDNKAVKWTKYQNRCLEHVQL